MTSKERVRIALAHEEPDRVPIDFWMTPEVESRQLRRAGMTDPFEMRVAAGHDLLMTSVGMVSSFYLSRERRYVDPWGITFENVPHPDGTGSYTEIVGHPLAGDDSLLASYRSPDPEEPRQYEAVASLIRRWGDTHCIVGGVHCSVFEGPWYLRGMERFLEDMLVNKDYAHELIDKVAAYYLIAGLKLARMGCDVLLAGDDVGMQDRMLISPSLWREFVKPRYGRLFDAYRSVKPDLRIAVHICGFIEPIIDDLIEVGVDILNPVQPLAMDPGRLKRRYGDRLAFWGAVDDQKALPLGTPREVEEEVRLRLRQLGPGGGYILCPSHSVQPMTPMENVDAFYRAAGEYRGYPMEPGSQDSSEVVVA
jgi:uroporphyrinogen decarboxylase